MVRGKTQARPGTSQAAWNDAFARQLLAWYRRHQRHLPWRENADAYRVWVSEIMLQQTQVATVVPYFSRFVAAFPSVADLAAAAEHDVLRLWEGLGYYRRARQMHRAARLIVADHGGKFPRNLDVISTLPGIGRYTAGAIASIAFDQRTPILEANTRRVYCRLAGFRADPTTTAARTRLWQFAETILPERDCRSFNQALMELGSLVCTVRNPNCEACPVRELCAACQSGLQDRIPPPALKRPSEAVREAAVVVCRGDRLLLRRRAAGERWAGLWDFFRFGIDAEEEKAVLREIVAKVRRQSGLSIGKPRHLATIKHGVTRFRITLDCYRASIASRSKAAKLPVEEYRWVQPDELESFALSMTGRKLGRQLSSETMGEHRASST